MRHAVANGGGINWYVPERGPGGLGDIVSHLPPVERAVQVAAVKIAIDATAALARHRDKGRAEIEIARHPNPGARTPDWYVYMKDMDPGGEGIAGKNRFDRSAMSIEFGWTQTHAFGKKLAEPVEHEGLHILQKAMNRAASRYRGAR
jgi:hypothetical protein